MRRALPPLGWAISLLGLALCIQFILAYSNVGSDFMQDYAGATALLSGRPIYGSTINEIIVEQGLGDWGIRNNHPPSTALLFLPFTALSYRHAFIALGCVSLLLLALMVAVCCRELQVPPWVRPAVFGFCFCWYPVIYCLGTGQSSILIAACVTFGWLALANERDEIAGALFGTAALFKLFPGLLALYLLAVNRRRALLIMAATFVVGAALSAVLGGLEVWTEYLLQIIASDVAEWNAFVLNASLSGVVERFLGTKTAWVEPLAELPQAAAAIRLALKFAVAAALIRRLWRVADRDEACSFSLTVIAMLLISPITWTHIFPVLIYPILLVLMRRSRQPKAERSFAPFAAVLLLSIPDVLLARYLMSLYAPGYMPWYAGLMLIGPTLGLIVLGCALLRVSKA